MDYCRCNFEQFKMEWEQNKKIMWEIPVAPQERKRGEKWRINPRSKLVNMIHNGDVIFFYVCNIPTSSGDSISRILLRGIVEDEPFVASYGDVYWNAEKENEKMVTAFTVGKLTTLTKEDLENNFFLNYNELSRKYGDKFRPQGKKWPNTNDKNLSEEMKELLESSFKKNSYKNDFMALIRHFNQKCYFCGKIGITNDHKTFKRRNGTDYFEYHHFIQQHKGEAIAGLETIIDDPLNKICLCSNCHNKIHYGRIEEINKMLQILYEDKKVQEMLSNKNFQSIIGENENPMDWIKLVYKLNVGMQRKDCDIV